MVRALYEEGRRSSPGPQLPDPRIGPDLPVGLGQSPPYGGPAAVGARMPLVGVDRDLAEAGEGAVCIQLADQLDLAAIEVYLEHVDLFEVEVGEHLEDVPQLDLGRAERALAAVGGGARPLEREGGAARGGGEAVGVEHGARVVA